MPVSRAHGPSTTHRSTSPAKGEPAHDGVVARKTLKEAGGGRLTGEAREVVAKEVVSLYERGATVRSIAQDVGKSYGFVHGLLKSSGVDMRARGGSRPRG